MRDPGHGLLVKQSRSPIGGTAEFEAATAICDGGEYSFSPTSVGQELDFTVRDLEPATTYHYAVQAKNELGMLGPISDTVSAITDDLAHTGTTANCPPVSTAAPDQIALAGGRYSLVGLPAGTLVQADSPLYGWFNLGAGGAYSVRPGSAPVEAGRGYWAFSFCDKVVGLAGVGTHRARLPLGAYHASMVGNPSGARPASVNGHDFAARWDPAANDGAGGYQLSGYRQSQPRAVGEGAWVFSYADTTIDIASGP